MTEHDIPPGPFTVSVGIESYVVCDATGQAFTEFHADFENNEWTNHAKAKARADYCCAALNIAHYTAMLKGAAA
jgi:hypothetical protein